MKQHPARHWLSAFPVLIAFKIYFIYMMRRILGMYELSFTFAQTGEDRILAYLLPYRNGFYIDVGCSDPLRESNTLLMYLSGWRGICIDANPDLINKFKRVRKKDIVLQAVVSDVVRQATYYISDESPNVNTIDEETFKTWSSKWKYSRTNQFVTTTLNDICDAYIKDTNQIDLLSIDVEGHELNVLKSIDLYKYRPKVIVVEIHDLRIDQAYTNNVVKFLTGQGYVLQMYATMNAYFVENSK